MNSKLCENIGIFNKSYKSTNRESNKVVQEPQGRGMDYLFGLAPNEKKTQPPYPPFSLNLEEPFFKQIFSSQI